MGGAMAANCYSSCQKERAEDNRSEVIIKDMAEGSVHETDVSLQIDVIKRKKVSAVGAGYIARKNTKDASQSLTILEQRCFPKQGNEYEYVTNKPIDGAFYTG